MCVCVSLRLERVRAVAIAVRGAPAAHVDAPIAGLYDSNASQGPRRANFVAVSKGTPLLGAYRVRVVPAQARLPVKTLRFDVMFFSAPEANDVGAIIHRL